VGAEPFAAARPEPDMRNTSRNCAHAAGRCFAGHGPPQ